MKMSVPDGYYVEGGGLPHSCDPKSDENIKFKVAEVHFLFTAIDLKGVEHILYDLDDRIAFEAQAFAHDPKYKSLDEALKKGGGKGVMGVSMPHRVGSGIAVELVKVAPTNK